MRRRLASLLAVAVLAALGSSAALSGSPAAPGPRATDAASGPTGATGEPGPATPLASVPTIAPQPDPTPVRTRPPIASESLRLALGARLDALRSEAAIPGISATIVFSDGSSWSGASGLADVAAGEPVTRDTAFALASISKTYTASLVVALAGDGILGLDDSAAAHLPGIELDPAITIRQLLDHTSGLDDYFLNPRIDAALLADRAATWSPDRTLGFVGPRTSAPGRAWRYSNTNYLLLGLIAERATGRTYAALVRERFFEPLGLDSAFVQVNEAPRGPVAKGYRFAGPALSLPAIDLSDGSAVVPFTSVVTAAGAAGSIAASSADVARWAWSLYRGRVLEPEALAAMLGDVDLVAGFRPRVPYGLGVQAIPVDRFPTYGHSGRFVGFRGAVRYLPGEGVAIAVLTNQSRADPSIIVRELLATALPLVDPCARCPAAR